MFQEGNYDIINFPMPREGMNQFIAPDILPPQFAYYLENILPTPLGTGQIRYGTRKLISIPNPEAKILEAFKFITLAGDVQAVLYTQYYKQDLNVQNPVVNAQNTLGFTTPNTAEYVPNTQIKVIYTLNGVNYTLYALIAGAMINDQNVVITLAENFFPAGAVTVQSVWYAAGALYAYDFNTQALTDLNKSNLSVACIPRGTFFQQTLIICNGVDKVLSWDGLNLKEVVDFVKERYANTFTRLDNQEFSFVIINGFDAAKYFNGNLIQLSINGVISQLIIANVVVDHNLLTITTQQVLPAFTAQDNVQMFYQDWPPTFNYIYAGIDRLWALGPGSAGIQFRAADEALRVYYTYEPNTLTAWFNETTKMVPSIDMSDKQGTPDNFEAICQVNGLTAFLGRSKTQVWSGSIPGNDGDFQYSSNLPVGTIHGNLVVNMPNDVYFVSQSGLQSFSTLNWAKQFAATSANAIDPIVNNFLTEVTSSNVNYWACRSFKYEQGNFGGFKIGNNKVLVSLFQTNFYSWVFFSGDFLSTNCFSDLGRMLCLGIGNTLYQYADGNDGSQKLYADQNGTGLISFSWIPGLISMKGRSGKRFANRRYELILDYPSQFPLNDLNQVQIKINGYIPRTFELVDDCQFQKNGDVLERVPMGQMRLGIPYEFVNKKLKFVSASFWLTLSGYVMNGPLSFKQLRLFGIGERNG